jgi:rhodanese-related sulfurtransferase
MILLSLGVLALAAAAADAGAGAASTTVTHVDAAQAARLVATNGAVILDIRTPKEHAAGHLRGATNVDFYAKDFASQLKGLDRRRTYLVHCASGGRSAKSLATFKELGFTSVVHLNGGFKAWSAAGLPVEK